MKSKRIRRKEMKVLREIGRTVIQVIELILGFENVTPRHDVLTLNPKLLYFIRAI
jgi:hypothetical protein